MKTLIVPFLKFIVALIYFTEGLFIITVYSVLSTLWNLSLPTKKSIEQFLEVSGYPFRESHYDGWSEYVCKQIGSTYIPEPIYKTSFHWLLKKSLS